MHTILGHFYLDIDFCYRPAMTIAVDLGRKATKQTNKTLTSGLISRFFVSGAYLLYHS